MNRKIEISQRTIIFIAGFIGSLWVIYQIKDVLILLFVAVILMSALSPLVDNLTKYKIPKTLSIIVVYIGILSFFILLISLIVAPLVSQTANLINILPHAFAQISPNFGIDPSLIQRELANLSRNAASVLFAIFSNLITLISLAVLTFYLLIDKDRLHRLIVQLFPEHIEKSKSLIAKIEEKLGAWFRGQVILSLIIGTVCYILLFSLGVPYALPLAILAGLMEVVPVIGPIISAIPAILIAFITAPVLAIFTALGYFFIQQAENSFIVPQVMKKTVGLNPLIVIIAIAIGGRLLGIPGALLAVPITAVIQILAKELLNIDLDAYSRG